MVRWWAGCWREARTTPVGIRRLGPLSRHFSLSRHFEDRSGTSPSQLSPEASPVPDGDFLEYQRRDSQKNLPGELQRVRDPEFLEASDVPGQRLFSAAAIGQRPGSTWAACQISQFWAMSP